MGITPHVLILAGAAIDDNPLYASYPRRAKALAGSIRSQPEFYCAALIWFRSNQIPQGHYKSRV